MTWMEWYRSLAKPAWTPSPSTITLIWMILYPIILDSFGYVFVQAFRSKLPWRVALPFAKNLVANLLFMPIFAGLRNVPLAAADILIVWATIQLSITAMNHRGDGHPHEVRHLRHRYPFIDRPDSDHAPENWGA